MAGNTLIRSWRWRSGGDHSDPEVALRVRQGTLPSRACSCSCSSCSCSSSSCCCCCCCWCCCCCCCCSFFLSPVVADNRQIGCVFTCFCTLRSKKHREYQCFWRFGSPKPRYLPCFFPLVAKITVFTVFFCPKGTKQCFGSALRVRGWRRRGGAY